MSKPKIDVQLKGHSGAQDVTTTYDIELGPLAMPAHIKIGSKASDGIKISNYAQQVDEYRLWLRKQIEQGNRDVMQALDHIYNKAISNGIIITSVCMPVPYVTHSHAARDLIMEMAGES